MAAFQNNVVRIATIIFIFFMALTSLMLLLAKQNQKFPPMYPTCPDYYTLKSEGEQAYCQDIKGLDYKGDNQAKCVKLNISDDKYRGWKTQQIKNKLKWATDCGVTWDGLTNVNINK